MHPRHIISLFLLSLRSSRATLSLLFLLLILLPSAVHAKGEGFQTLIQVYPSILSLSLMPGKTQNYEVFVRNISDAPMPVHLSFESFQLQDDDTTKGPVPTLSSWTTFTPEDMILASGEAKKVTITTKLPSKIPLGGYYGDIAIEPRRITPKETQTSASVQPKLMVLLLGSVGVPQASEQNGLVQPLSRRWVFFSSKIPIEFKVKNTSLYHFSGKPFIKLVPLLGNMSEIELEEKLVLPGRTRTWDVVMDSPKIPHLIYKKIISVSVGNGEKIVATQTILVIPPLLQLSLLILAALITLFPLYKKRNNIVKAIQILFTGKDVS